MAATITNSSTFLSQPVNYVLMKGLLSAARKKLPYFNGTLAGNLQKNGGSAAVKWERINNLSAATSTLGELNGTMSAFFGRNFVTPTLSVVTATVLKKGNAILCTEEIDLYNVNTKAAKLLDTLGANAGESLNSLMFTAYSGALNVRYATNLTGGGAAGNGTGSYVAYGISLGDIKYAVNLLNSNAARTFTPLGTGSTNVGTQPIRSSYYGICHVDVEEDVRALTGFVPVEQYAGYTETMPFEFGAVGGVRWASTQVSTIASAASKASTTAAKNAFRPSASAKNNDVYASFVYGQEAVGTVGLGNMHATNSYEMYNPKTPPAVEIIYKPLGSAGALDPYNEVASLSWKAFHVGQILNQQWVCMIKSLASKL
jgi:N4-gp56 family major capsid protein